MFGGDGVVPGVLVDFDPARVDDALPILDEVEDTATDTLRRIEVVTTDGATAWAYHYTHDVDGLAPIDRWADQRRALSPSVTQTACRSRRRPARLASMSDVIVPAVAPVHLDTPALEAGLDEIRNAPRDNGTLELIVRRPAVDAREILDEAELSTAEGVVGDTWNVRGSGRTADGSSAPGHAAQRHQRPAVPPRRR